MNHIGVADHEAKLKAIAAMSILPVTNKVTFDLDGLDGFKDLPFSRPSTLTWKDKEPGRKPYFMLTHFRDNQELELYNYAINTFADLHANMSCKTVVKLLVLAYNLKDDSECYLFAPICRDLCLDVEKRDISEFSGAVVSNSFYVKSVNPLTSSEDKTTVKGRKRIVTSLCFIAASLLRTAIKSASDYTRIAKHLAPRFKHFYGYDLAVSNYAPTNDAVQGFKCCLNNEIIKHTLYMLFYAGEENKNGGCLKDFLYRRDTQCKGMHVFELFRECSKIYNVTTRELIQVLQCPGNKNVLQNLETFFNNFVDNTDDQELKLKMWKYARIFDHKFFADLQTKNCVHFVAVLAYMIEMEGADDKRRKGDVMNITLVANLPPSEKNVARLLATSAKSMIRDLVIKRADHTESMESRVEEVQDAKRKRES